MYAGLEGRRGIGTGASPPLAGGSPLPLLDVVNDRSAYVGRGGPLCEVDGVVVLVLVVVVVLLNAIDAGRVFLGLSTPRLLLGGTDGVMCDGDEGADTD